MFQSTFHEMAKSNRYFVKEKVWLVLHDAVISWSLFLNDLDLKKNVKSIKMILIESVVKYKNTIGKEKTVRIIQQTNYIVNTKNNVWGHCT